MPKPLDHLDERLKDWATETQKQYIDAINLHRSMRGAAKALGKSYSTLKSTIEGLKHRAARQGYSPDHDMTRPVPDGFQLRGQSSLYRRGEPEPVLQWVKSSADTERQREIFIAAAEAMSEDIPRLPPLPLPQYVKDDLCNLYTMTDCHNGMLAWNKESGEDWDLAIAEKTLTGCFEQMVLGAKEAKTGLVNIAGDWNHYDGMIPMTPTNHHILDADGRFPKLVAATIRIQRRLVDLALLRHEIVILLVQEGNHDPVSSIWLRQMFKALYENEPRVIVIQSELPYYVYQHGSVMLGFHHGHLSKNGALPLLFAARYAKIWGETTKRYIHTGHRHHVDEKEHPGVKVIQHPTLAAKDAYAARGGWLSEREATAMTFHAKFGLVGRNTVTPEMLS